MEHSKICRSCGTEKPRADFYDNPSFRDGKDSQCKECVKARARDRAAERRATRPDPYDETGNIYGAWTVLREAEKPTGVRTLGRHWLCSCACGRSTQIIAGSRLRAGRWRRGCDLCTGRGQAINGKMSPAYQSWRGMRERCLRPDHASYANYGGRGITVCDRWADSFSNFLADMGERPPGTTLDRINVNGPYSPENCRWADAKTQSQNTRTFRLTDEQIEAIRNLLAAGARQIDIATAVGVSRAHIANIAIGNARVA